MGESIVLEFDVEFYRSLSAINFTLEFSRTEMGMRVLHLQNDDTGCYSSKFQKGSIDFGWKYLIVCFIRLIMRCIFVMVTRAGVLDYVEAISSFSMIRAT